MFGEALQVPPWKECGQCLVPGTILLCLFVSSLDLVGLGVSVSVSVSDTLIIATDLVFYILEVDLVGCMHMFS